MRVRMLVAAAVAAVVAGIAATAATAVPDPPLKITPDKQLQFGTVPIGTMVIKPVTILNRSNDWVAYAGADWPNFGYPGVGENGSLQPFPKGFWEVDPANPYGNTAPFTCWEIAPKSSCTLYFGWLPFEAGTHTSAFDIRYVSEADGVTLYPSQTITFIGTGY